MLACMAASKHASMTRGQRRPREGRSTTQPAPGQQHEPALRLLVLDHLQPAAVGLGLPLRLLAGVPLVHQPFQGDSWG